LPAKAKEFITRHPLLTDAVATWSTFKILGSTLTALTAAGIMSVGISGVLFLPALSGKIRRWRAEKH